MNFRKHKITYGFAGVIVGGILVMSGMAFAANGVFGSGNFSLGCHVGVAGAVTCSGQLPSAGTTTTTTTQPTTTTTTTQPTTTTTTVPVTTTTTTQPTTTTTTQAGGWQCTNSTLPQGSCGYYAGDPNFTGPIIATGGGNQVGEEVDQNDWSGSSDYGPATINANSPSNWQVVATATNSGGAILAYPNEWDHIVNGGGTGEPKIDSQNQITYTFNETMPHNAQTVGHFMMDNWADQWGYEIMTQVDFSNDGACGGSWPQVQTNITIDSQLWHLCLGNNGKSLDFKLGASDAAEVSESSGTIHVLDMLKWAETNGYLPAGSTLTALSSGYEIAGTGGVPEAFTVNSSSLTSS